MTTLIQIPGKYNLATNSQAVPEASFEKAPNVQWGCGILQFAEMCSLCCVLYTVQLEKLKAVFGKAFDMGQLLFAQYDVFSVIMTILEDPATGVGHNICM